MKRLVLIVLLFGAVCARAGEKTAQKKWIPLSEAPPRIMALAGDYTVKEISKVKGFFWERFLKEIPLKLADRALFWNSPETGVIEAVCFIWESGGNPDLVMTVEMRSEVAVVSFSRMTSSKITVTREGKTLFVFPPAREEFIEEGYFFELRAVPPPTPPSP